MSQAATIISFNGKRANDLADTTFTHVDTFGLKQTFRRCSMNELRVIQELLSDAVSSRKNDTSHIVSHALHSRMTKEYLLPGEIRPACRRG